MFGMLLQKAFPTMLSQLPCPQKADCPNSGSYQWGRFPRTYIELIMVGHLTDQS